MILDRRRKHPLNENVFSENNKEIPYWIGLLLTDGCIHFPKNRPNAPKLKLTLHKDDKHVLEDFSDFLGHDRFLTFDRNKYSINIYSLKLIKDLEKFNIVSNKTFVAEAPKCFLNNSSFWRGVIDGDGCIGINKDKVYIHFITASITLATQFLDFCKTIINTKVDAPYITLNKNDNEYYSFRFDGKQAIKIINKLYETDGPKLIRKYIKALPFLTNQEAA